MCSARSSPFADVRLTQGESPAEAVAHFLDQNLPMLILTDVGNVGDAHDRLAHWIEDGGVLVRFAGPRLAASDDDLVPVKLRRGGRILGGSLSWDKPQPLAGVFARGPVQRHAGAERRDRHPPGARRTRRGAERKHLGDACRRHAARHRRAPRQGLDRAVPCHRRYRDGRICRCRARSSKCSSASSRSPARPAAAEADKTQSKAAHEMLPPSHVLDGFGSFIDAAADGAAGAGGLMPAARRAEHPPGFYGPPESLLAVNTLTAADRLAPLDFSPLVTATREIYRTSEPQDLRGPIFLAALALLLLDTLVVLVPRRRPAAAHPAQLAGRGCGGDRRRDAGAHARPRQRAANRAESQRAAVGARNQACLCRHRQCRCRRDQQGRSCRPDAVSRATHRARAGRSDRPRYRPRRAGVLSADLLAGRARRAAPVRSGAQAHRHLHEGRRHRPVRHPRRGRGAARSRRRNPQPRHAGTAQNPRPRSTFPNSSRCRAITF